MNCIRYYNERYSYGHAQSHVEMINKFACELKTIQLYSTRVYAYLWFIFYVHSVNIIMRFQSILLSIVLI